MAHSCPQCRALFDRDDVQHSFYALIPRWDKPANAAEAAHVLCGKEAEQCSGWTLKEAYFCSEHCADQYRSEHHTLCVLPEWPEF